MSYFGGGYSGIESAALGDTFVLECRADKCSSFITNIFPNLPETRSYAIGGIMICLGLFAF